MIWRSLSMRLTKPFHIWARGGRLRRQRFSTTRPSFSSPSTCALSDLLSFPGFGLVPPPPSGYVTLKPGQRLICLGDVHGDYRALQHMLHLGGVYNFKTNQWSGGDAVVVQCGDVMDRGPQELACWSLMSKLSQQAAAAGGALTALWGNHEVFNALGLFHYTQGGDAEFEKYIGRPFDRVVAEPSGIPGWRRQFAGNQPARWAACEPGGILATTLWRNLSVALVIGRTLCVHAGLTVEHLDAYTPQTIDHTDTSQAGTNSLAALNAAARDWIATSHHGPNANILSSNLPGEEIIGQANARARAASRTLPACLGGTSAHANEEESPVWLRQYSSPPDEVPDEIDAVQANLDAVLQHVGASRMVMGHTPQDRINAALKGKAWRIDTGASRGMGGGNPEILEVIHGENDGDDVVFVIDTNGRRIPAVERTVR